MFQALSRLRQEAQNQIEFLINPVNEMDGDTDLEPEPVQPNLASFDCLQESQDDAEGDVCEDEDSQCEDEGVLDSGIADFDGLMEQCPGYSGSGASGFTRFVA